MCWSTPLIHWIRYFEHETKYNAGEILVKIILKNSKNVWANWCLFHLIIHVFVSSLMRGFYFADYETMYEVVNRTPRFQVFSALARRKTSLPWVFLSTLFDSHEDFVPLSSVQKRRQPKWARSKRLRSTVSQDFAKSKIQGQTCPLVCWKCVGKSALIDERSSKWYPLLLR